MWPEGDDRFGVRDMTVDEHAELAQRMGRLADAQLLAGLGIQEAKKEEEKPYLIGAHPKDDGVGTVTGQPLYAGGKLSDSLDHPMHNEEHQVLASVVRMVQRDMQKLITRQAKLEEAEVRRQEAWTKLSTTLEIEVREARQWVAGLNVQLEDSQTITRKLDDALIQIADIYEILEEID